MALQRNRELEMQGSYVVADGFSQPNFGGHVGNNSYNQNNAGVHNPNQSYSKLGGGGFPTGQFTGDMSGQRGIRVWKPPQQLASGATYEGEWMNEERDGNGK